MAFILVISTLYLALNYYVYSRISGGLKLATGAARILLALFLACALAFIPA